MQTYTLEQAAKILNQGRNTFTRQLKDLGLLGADNLPAGKFMNRGWFVVQPCSYHHPVVGLRHYGRTHITPNGLEYIARQLGVSITAHH